MFGVGFWGVNRCTLNQTDKSLVDKNPRLKGYDAPIAWGTREAAVVGLATASFVLRVLEVAHPSVKVAGFTRLGFGATLIIGAGAIRDPKAKEGLRAESRCQELTLRGWLQVIRGGLQLWGATKTNLAMDIIATPINLVHATASWEQKAPHKSHRVTDGVLTTLSGIELLLVLETLGVLKPRMLSEYQRLFSA